MKKFLKALSVIMLVFLAAVMLSSSSSAKEDLNLKLKRNAESIVLTWNGNKKESYSLYRKRGDGAFSLVATVKGKKYTDKSLVSGESYTYYVKKGSKVKSKNKKAVFVSAPKTNKPTINQKGITLKWKQAEGVSAYVVYRKQGKEKAKRLIRTDKLSFCDTTAEKGVIYTYNIRGVKNNKTSVASSLKAGILSSPELSAVEKTEKGLLVSWKKNEQADKYIVYRSLYGKNKFTKLAEVKDYILSYEDESAQSGVKYSYYVRALSGNSKSLYEGKSLEGVCIKAPEGFALTTKGKKVSLKWEKSEDATEYEIYKKIGGGKWKKLSTVKENQYTDTVKSFKKAVRYKLCAVTPLGKSVFTYELRAKSKVDPAKPMVALTFDDGPHPINTHRILDVLEKYDARATFFVVGSRIEGYSDCLERQGKLDCEVGNHSFSHIYFSSSKKKTVLEEIKKTDELIEKYSGQKPFLVRAPGGAFGNAPQITDRPFIQWSVDTMDWSTRSATAVVEHIKKTVRDGSIILMHDLYSSTAEATERIVPWLISEGYQLVTVTEMLEAKGIGVKGGKVYYNGYT